MDIASLEDLSALIELCRKKNIETVRIGKDTIELKFVEDAVAPKTRKARTGGKDSAIETTTQYTEDELLNWSSGFLPEVSTT